MIIFQDGFDHYGTDDESDPLPAQQFALDGRWASFEADIVTPAFSARTGPACMQVNPQSSGAAQGARVILPATYGTLFITFALYRENTPPNDNESHPVELRDASNLTQGYVSLQANGGLAFYSQLGTLLGTSAANTITNGTWHQLEVKVVKSATVGIVELRVNGDTVLLLSNQNTGATAIGQLRFHIDAIGGGSNFIDDLIVNDTSGAYNTSWQGTARVATLFGKADDETGWTPQRRYKFGNGVFLGNEDDGALSCSDSADFEFGSGDFTAETHLKWRSTPPGTDFQALFSKWREDVNARSYRLILGGPGFNGSKLRWQVSTDGTAGTEITVMEVDYAPVYGRWTHLCVQRSGGVTCIYADGVPLGAPVADASTYADTAALFGLFGNQDDSSTFFASYLDFADEVRITKGVARYNTSGFVPPAAAFPRSVGGGDADFASVSLLLGFDTALIDESSHGRAVTARGNRPPGRYAPPDAPPGAYKVTNEPQPFDDSYVEAPYIAAFNILTCTANLANGATVTFDGETYTFETVFSNTANKVLIGANVNVSLANLAAAANGDAGAGTLYGTGTDAVLNTGALAIGNGQLRVTANTPGTAGNAIVVGEVAANASWIAGSTTLRDGLDIPGPSSFVLQRLPPLVTGVRAICIVTRARKTDAGPGSLQSSFVTADNSSANGADNALTTDFTEYSDIIEEDPSTTTALTPASFIGSRVRVDRTL